MEIVKTPTHRAAHTNQAHIGVPPRPRPLTFFTSLNRASDFVSSYFSGTIRVNFVQIFLLFIPANNDKIFNDAKNAKVSNKSIITFNAK